MKEAKAFVRGECSHIAAEWTAETPRGLGLSPLMDEFPVETR